MNAMSMDHIFTEIDARSYASIVKNGYLSEVLLALLVDPLEAADMADSIQRIQATRIELAFDGKIIDAPITLKDFHSLPSKDAFKKLKITLSQWAMTTDRADIAVEKLTIWYRCFGAWCTCAIARETLRYVPAGERRPLRAIEVAEALVIGKTTIGMALEAADAAYAAADAAADDTDDDAYAAKRAARAAAYAARAAADASSARAYAAYAANAAADAAAAAASSAEKHRAIQDAELIRLREVVSNACLTFPG